MTVTPTSGTGDALFAARPTVRVDAQEYATVRELLVSFEMTEQEGGLSALELRVTNFASDADGGADFAFEDDRVLRIGALVTVYAGEERAPQEVFRGTITALEAEYTEDGAPTLVALAEDVFQQARMARRTRIHDDATIADLANDLASTLGLTPQVTGLSDNIGTQVQLNESDLAFLRRLLARHDADLQVVGEELHVSPRAEVRRGTLELRLRDTLRRARVLADLAHQVTEVTVRGWDATQGQTVRGTSRGGSLGPGTGRPGARLLRDAIGARPHHLGHIAVGTDAEASAVAEAAYDERARRFIVVEGTADGNAALRVGTNVTLLGLGPRFDNTYYVTFARHRYDRERGYQTDFVAECAYMGQGGSR